MKGTVYQAILDKLNDDATLQGYFGSTFFAFRAGPLTPLAVPSITLQENTEKSKPRVGYTTTAKTRDNSPTIQVDIWVSSGDESFPCTGEDTDLIAERIDELFLDATSEVTGTKAGTWEKMGSSQQHESDERIWHNALRYSFEYSITDT
jgi:hypothetical protein